MQRRAEEMRAVFKLTHMSQRTAGEALGFKSFEAGAKLRELVRRGWLREIESPRANRRR